MTKLSLPFVALGLLSALSGCAAPGTSGDSVHLWPLYDRDTTSGDSLEVLWPLYSHEINGPEDYRVRQVPLFAWERDGAHRELDVLWPLFKLYFGDDRRGGRLAPLYFHHRSPAKNYDVVFPILWWWHDEAFHLWPLYSWDEDGGHGTLWPLIGFSSERTKILPFFYSKRTEEERTLFVFPYGSRTEGDERTRWIVPFYLEHRGPVDHLRLVLPFWYNAKNTAADTRGRVVFPFYWDFRREEDYTTVVAPVYGRRHTAAGRDTQFIAPPLYIYDRDRSAARSSHHLLWPLFERGSGTDYSRTRVFPFEYGWEESVSDAGEEGEGENRIRRSHFRIYPLYFANHRSNGAGETVRHHTLFPLWWYKDDPVAKRSHNVVFPLLWHYRSEHRATDFLFPLLWVQNDLREDEQYYSFLWPLTWYRTSPRTSDFRFLWKLIEVTNDREAERSHWALNPIVRMERVGEDERRFDLLGGLFGVRVREGETSLRFFYFLEI